MNETQALLIVDLQNDFCPGGALAVPEGDAIVPVINDYIGLFKRARRPVIASRDWHPQETSHFKEFGGRWPGHCRQGHSGAQFHPALRLPKDAIIVSKGMDPHEDAYSAFQARDGEGRALKEILAAAGVSELFIGGLAIDFCVLETTMNALENGFQVLLLADAIKGISARDSAVAVDQMKSEGVRTITYAQAQELVGP